MDIETCKVLAKPSDEGESPVIGHWSEAESMLRNIAGSAEEILVGERCPHCAGELALFVKTQTKVFEVSCLLTKEPEACLTRVFDTRTGKSRPYKRFWLKKPAIVRNLLTKALDEGSDFPDDIKGVRAGMYSLRYEREYRKKFNQPTI